MWPSAVTLNLIERSAQRWVRGRHYVSLLPLPTREAITMPKRMLGGQTGWLLFSWRLPCFKHTCLFVQCQACRTLAAKGRAFSREFIRQPVNQPCWLPLDYADGVPYN